jgi:hypothetical protein
MFKKLMPFLLLLVFGRVMAYENPIEIIEYIDDVKVVAYINKSDINTKIEWTPFESPLPLSIDDALHAVQEYIQSDDDITDVKLSGIELKRIARHEMYWHYLVKLKYKSGDETRPHFFVVLMDGKVISALREPESIK